MNKASVILSQKLDGRGAVSELSRELGVSHVTVLRWASGERKPKTKARLRLQEKWPELGLPLWDEDLSVAPEPTPSTPPDQQVA